MIGKVTVIIFLWETWRGMKVQKGGQFGRTGRDRDRETDREVNRCAEGQRDRQIDR